MSTTATIAASPSATPATPAAKRLDVGVRTELVAGTATEVSVSARHFTWTIDEPAGLGGSDLGANPVEHLLAALGSCTVITYQVWAQQLGLALDSISVDVSGTIDTRGFFGLDDAVRPGFDAIQLRVALGGPAAVEDSARLADAVAAHCPVLDNLISPVTVERTVTIG